MALTIVEVTTMLVPLFPFFFLILHEITARPGARMMFGIFAAASAIFMSFEIATRINWLSVIYFLMGIGVALKLAVETKEYEERRKKEVKK